MKEEKMMTNLPSLERKKEIKKQNKAISSEDINDMTYDELLELKKKLEIEGENKINELKTEEENYHSKIYDTYKDDIESCNIIIDEKKKLKDELIKECDEKKRQTTNVFITHRQNIRDSYKEQIEEINKLIASKSGSDDSVMIETADGTLALPSLKR